MEEMTREVNSHKVAYRKERLELSTCDKVYLGADKPKNNMFYFEYGKAELIN